MRKKKNLIFKVLFGIAYSIIGAEIFFRIFAPMSILPRRVCAAPYGIRANKPNQTYWQKTAEYKIQIKTNSKGIRANREIPYEKPDNIKRIVLLGDSFGIGYEVNYEDMFSTRMEYYLNHDHHINSEVVNLSTSGHGNSEELIVLVNEGLKYQPDLVLLAWHSTDPGENIRSNLYGLKDNSLVKLNDTFLPAVAIREKLEKIPLYQYIEENSHFYTYFREMASVKTKAVLSAIYSNQRNPNSHNDVAVQQDYSKRLTLALLDQIQNVCIQNKIKFMIFDIPARQTREGYTKYYSEFPLTIEDAQNRYSFFSPIENFEKAENIVLYRKIGHGHFNPMGNDIAGKGLAEFIARNQLLAPAK